MAAEPSIQDHDPALLDRLLDKQRDSWRRGERLLVETLLEGHPSVAADRERLLDLIWNEVDLRAAGGDAPQLDEYQKRFPALSDDLRKQFEVFAALPPTDDMSPARDQQPSDTIKEGAGSPPMELPPPAIKGYDDLKFLGKGGMGVVYRARQTAADRVVALKMILGTADEESRQRFHTEAHAVAAMQHPNVVQVFEVGEHAGTPFFSMEFCAGGSLEGRLGGTPLPPTEAARLVEAVARAVHHAHERGVVHRDLKPANVLLTEDGTPKVTDFGLAKKLNEVGLTQPGAVMGSPPYMAPEQASGKTKEIGPRSDVYSLGAILYECLTGRPPFKAATLVETLFQVINDEPAPPRGLQSKTPRDLETICLKCLQKQAGKRYASADALAEDLRRYQAGEPIVGRPVGTAERALKWARRRPAAAAAYGLLATALVLGVGGGGATWLWLGAEDARATAVKLKGEAETARGRAEIAEGEAKTAKRQLTQYAYDDRAFLAQREWDAGRPKRARELLEDASALQETLTPGRRPWEWDYLNRTFHQELVLEGRTGSVHCVAFSPDGAQLASAGDDNTVHLWDATTGKQLAVLKGHTNSVASVAFSPDCSRLASASWDGTVRLWDAASGKSLAVLEGHADSVWSVAFSPDGARLASAGAGETVQLWNGASGKPLAVLKGHTNSVWSVAFSPDGARLASAGADKTVRLWDAASGKPLDVLEGHTGPVLSVAFSPDGSRLASAGTDHTVRLWDATTGKPLAALEGHTREINSVAFSPDGGRLASAGFDHTVRLWDAISAKPLAILQGHTDLVHSVAFSADGARLASAGADETVRLWDVATGSPLAALEGHVNSVWSVAFSPDGARLASAGADKTVRLWDAASGKPLNVLKGHTDYVTSVTFSPDGGQLASASEDNTVRLWDSVSGKPLAVLEGHTSSVESVAFSPDGARLASASEDGTVRLWNAATGKPLAVLKGHHMDTVRFVAFSPDGARLASASDDMTMRLWDAASGSPVAVLEGHTGSVMSVAFSPDGAQLASASTDKTVRLWDVASGKSLAVLEGHTSSVMSVAFSPDGGRLASASDDKTVRLWDAATGKPLAVLEGHTSSVDSVAFSPDGARLASAGGGPDLALRLWIARESPDDLEKRRAFAREQQADAAERGGEWFAAAFHLSRLIDVRPTAAALYARRCRAEVHLKRWQPAAADFLQALMRWPADDDAK